MATVKDEQSQALSVRAKAEQDLSILQTRMSELEIRLREMRAEERDLQGFLRRLNRYDPQPDNDEIQVTPTELRAQAEVSIRPRRGYGAHSFRFRSHTPADTSNFAVAIEQLDHELRETAATAAAKSPVSSQALIGSAVAVDPSDIADDYDRRAAAHVSASEGELSSGDLAAIPKADSRRGKVNNFVLEVMLMVGDGAAFPTKTLASVLRHEVELYAYLGTRPEATLSSYLSRDPRFAFSRERGGWVLTNTPAGEDADQDSEIRGSVDQMGGGE